MKIIKYTLVLAMMCVAVVSQMTMAQPPTSSPALTPDDAITRVISDLMTAYSTKDLERWSRSWVSDSPHFYDAREELKEIFASSGPLKGTASDCRTIQIASDTATVEAGLSFEQRGDRAYTTGKWRFLLAQDAQGWKIFKQISPERAVAEELVRASDGQLASVIDRAKQFAPRLLVSALILESGGVEPPLDLAGKERILGLALDFAEKYGDVFDVAKCLGSYSVHYRERGNYLRALEFENRTLELMRINHLDRSIADSLSSIGLIHLVKGSPAEALPFLEESNRLFERIGPKGANWVTIYRMGHAYLQMGDYARAMDFYQQSVELLRARDPKDELAVQNVTIANLYEIQGDHEQARALYEKALASFLKTGSQYGQSISLAGLAEVYQNLEQYDKAAEYETKALDIRRSTGNLSQSFISLKRLGIDYAAMGDSSTALEYFNEALAIARSRNADNQLSDIYLEIAKLRLARADLTAASEGIALAREHAEKLPDQAQSWELYAVSGRIKRMSGKLDEARSDLNHAVKIIETTNIAGGNNEKERFYAGRISAYDDLIELELSQGRMEEAFMVSERRRSRALIDTLRNGNAGRSKDGYPESKDDKRLRDEIASLNSQIGKLIEKGDVKDRQLSQFKDELDAKRLEYERFKTKLYVSHPELVTSRGEMQPINLADTISLLSDKGSLLLEYLVTNEKTYAFAITRGSSNTPRLKVYQLNIGKDKLAATIDKFRTGISNGDLGFASGARHIYDLLLRPLAPELAAKTNVIIVPDGPLWELPFQAIQDPAGKYFIERSTISYAPSLTALREMKKNSRPVASTPGSELVAFGNPVVSAGTSAKVKRVFMSERLEPLPEAERLVNGLAKMYGPGRSKVYTGAEAREQIAKSEVPKYRVVQFATHGILNNASPMYSHLVLAQNDKDSKEDGLLEAWEMKDLDLKADLVVLSACDTARGKISGGEGVIGMAWAMFIAGAPTTVASQWRVESSSTTELMLEFHRQLLTRRVSKAEALRRAELSVLHNPKYRHPSYWGAWVMIGTSN